MDSPISSTDRHVLEVTLGQRTLASVHGEQTTATAYAGLGTRHLLLTADGAEGPVPSRLAAQIATSAAVARFRGSVFPHTEEQLREAVAEAHQAVRRGALGTHAEGQAGASLTVVVIEPGGVTAARVGGGRVYVLIRDRLRPLFREEGRGYVGDPSSTTEIVSFLEPLPAGSRIIAVTEAVARAVAADLDQLASGPPAQLVATRLTDAARRRGQYEALAAQVCEIQESPMRPGPHPAFARIDREASRTLSADGRWLGPADPSRGRPHSRTESGWFIWFFVAALLGAGAAFIAHGGGAGPAREAAPVAHAPDSDAIAATTAPPDPGPSDDVGGAAPDAGAPILAPNVAADIAALFEHATPTRAAHAIRNYITKRWQSDGDRVFDDLEAWITTHDDPVIIGALLELSRDRDLRRTYKWLNDLLPRLYSRAGGDPAADAAP